MASRRPLRLVMGAVATAVALSTSLAFTASPALADGTSSSGTRLSGSNGGGTPLAAAAFGLWRGTPDTIVNNFLPHATWNDFANPPVWGGPDSWIGAPIKVSWAVPMLPVSGGDIQTGATGAYNQYFLSLAQKLVADGQGDAVIRLGWEMNGSWMTWNGLSDPVSWVAYWRQIVTTMRSVAGANFAFLWAPNVDVNYDLTKLYPGNDYVDQVGMSVYDQGQFAPSQVAQRWSELYDGYRGSLGLAWLAQFANANGKPMAFGEWGLSQRCDGHGGGDDPYFIQKMHDFFANNNVAWETYFNVDVSVDPSSCEYHAITGGTFPQAAALYRQLWDADAASVAAVQNGGAAVTDTIADPSLPETSLAVGLPAVATMMIIGTVVLRRRRSRRPSGPEVFTTH